MRNYTIDVEFVGFVAACLLGVPLVPFAPPMLGLWCFSLASRGHLPVAGARQARVPLIVFAVLSLLGELCWGHGGITDYGDVWFDNLFAGLIVPASVVGLATLLVWFARDAAAFAYRHRHSGE